MRTISEIISAAGGAETVARHLAKHGASSVKASAVYKWPTNGVPDRHWRALMALAGATEAELFAANEAVRSAAKQDREVA